MIVQHLASCYMHLIITVRRTVCLRSSVSSGAASRSGGVRRGPQVAVAGVAGAGAEEDGVEGAVAGAGAGVAVVVAARHAYAGTF